MFGKIFLCFENLYILGEKFNFFHIFWSSKLRGLHSKIVYRDLFSYKKNIFFTQKFKKFSLNKIRLENFFGLFWLKNVGC